MIGGHQPLRDPGAICARFSRARGRARAVAQAYPYPYDEDDDERDEYEQAEIDDGLLNEDGDFASVNDDASLNDGEGC